MTIPAPPVRDLLVDLLGVTAALLGALEQELTVLGPECDGETAVPELKQQACVNDAPTALAPAEVGAGVLSLAALFFAVIGVDPVSFCPPQLPPLVDSAAAQALQAARTLLRDTADALC